MPGQPYRGFRVYAFVALARLFHALDLDLRQPDLFVRAPARIEAPAERVSKEQILRAIRSNSHMTDKVVRYRVEQGYASIARDDRGYDIRITVAGVEHLRRYSGLYRETYAREIGRHYQYRPPPGWLG